LDFALEPEMRDAISAEKKEEQKPVVEEKKEERQPKPIDESRIPKDGPYVAYIGNLPYSVKEQDIEGFFPECQVCCLRY
jgi:RNA recognition motif-containing protein